MGPVVLAVLALTAPAAPVCPGAADKPAVLRCYEAGDRAATVEAARAELGRAGATADERRFAVELAEEALRDLYTDDKDPAHLCELQQLLAEYIATPGALAEAAEQRNKAELDLQRDHPGRRCDDAQVSDGATTSQPTPLLPSPPRSRPELLPVPPRRVTPPGRGRVRMSPRTISGVALLIAAAGLGAGAAGVAVQRDELRDGMRALRDEAWTRGWTPAQLQEARAPILEADRRSYSGMVGLAVSSAVVGALGVGLVVAGERGRRRAELAPMSTLRGAGLAIAGRF